MTVFDYDTFLRMSAEPNADLFRSAGTAFGVPECMLGLGEALLSLLPGSILSDMSDSVADGQDAAKDVLEAISREMRLRTGIIEFDTETGRFRLISQSSKNGNEAKEGSVLNKIAGYVGAAAGFAGVMYTAYRGVETQVREIKECFDQFEAVLKYKGGNASEQRSILAEMNRAAFDEMNEAEFANLRNEYNTALGFLENADAFQSLINQILADRAEDPSLEPAMNSELFPEDLGFRLEDPEPQPPVPTEIFRLAYGPPVSKIGRFILSKDGLYYNSQDNGLTPAILNLRDQFDTINQNFERWKLGQAANLGGRGDAVSTKDLFRYSDSILDPNIIDESKDLREYYDNDNVVEALVGQRNLRMYEVSSQINELESTPGASVAIIQNLRQSLVSENASFIEKINKRKKQIELAVRLSPKPIKKGEVPVNNFSYLADSNILLTVENQRKLTLSQDEVSSVVLPVSSYYVVPAKTSTNITLDHLVINNIGIGGLIFDSSSVSSTNPIKLTLTDVITVDKLFSLYNFLDTNVELPNSKAFLLDNGISNKNYNNAQLNALSISSVFGNGLGIAYLQGITKNNGTTPSAMGSFIRLPETSQYNDFMYWRGGATLDLWMYLPNLTNNSWVTGSPSSLYRIILANENTGLTEGASARADENFLQPEYSTDIVKGALIGFTVDRRLTENASGSNNPADNSVDSLKFFIAPTQSKDASTVGFINKSKKISDDCYSQTTWYSFNRLVETANAEGVALTRVASEFCNLSLTFNPYEDKISLYLDGSLLQEGSLSDTFAIEKYAMPNIPTMKKANSFEYNASTTPVANLEYGPKLGKYFTPWIIGGGYTDGNPYKNFMGGSYGGVISGLRGYVGSVKFYNKPLTSTEVVNNYKAQKDFFKNIDVNSFV